MMPRKSHVPSLRFSLRNLLLFTAIASILISTLVGFPAAEFRRQRAIGMTLGSRGCWVDWRPSTRNWGADFFSRIGLGQAYLRIRGVEFEEGWNIKNDDLKELLTLNNLAWLSIHDSMVDDQGLLHLNNCKSLTDVDLKDSVLITDLGLRNLNLTDLSSLNVDGTKVTYDGLKWITNRNPRLDEPTLIGRLALSRLEQTQFRCSPQIASRSKLRLGDAIRISKNSRQQWHNAAPHLREFPGLVIYQFRDLPDKIGPEVEWGLTLSIVNVVDGAKIVPGDIQGDVRKHTIAAVAVIPPIGMAVSRLVRNGEIRAWFGSPGWPAKVGADSLEIPASAEIVFVDSESLPLAVECTVLPAESSTH